VAAVGGGAGSMRPVMCGGGAVTVVGNRLISTVVVTASKVEVMVQWNLWNFSLVVIEEVGGCGGRRGSEGAATATGGRWAVVGVGGGRTV
jgi:hypothetical protein